MAIGQPNWSAGLSHIIYYVRLLKDPQAGLERARETAERIAAKIEPGKEMPADYQSNSFAYTEAVAAKRLFDKHEITVQPEHAFSSELLG